MSVRVPLALAAALFALALPSAALTQGGMDFGNLVLRAADGNRDGELARAEWEAFTAGAVAGETVDAALLQARVLVTFLDADRDGRATLDELEAALEAPHAEGRGSIGREFAVEAGDTDADGQLAQNERLALLLSTGVEGGDALPEAALVSWIGEVARRNRGDRSALTPAVVLTSIGAALDATRDGKLAPADLERLFGRFDADGDGLVSAEELRPVRRTEGERGPRASLEEQRKQPVLIDWQRNLDDALALSRQRNQPLLICVNMDGESASESLAWYRYRDPEFAELALGFVCLVVSPDTHSAFSHDDRGRRVLDPRLGAVLDSEHIALEPLLFERWFNGQRVAPRHVGVSPAGEVLFDLFLLGDLSEIDAALRAHGVRAAELLQETVVTKAMLDHDARMRAQLELLAVEGDWRLRFEVAAHALSTARGVQHPELVRLALRDPDARVRRQVLWTVARELGQLDLELWDEALRVSAEDAQLRGVLLAACARLARESADAARVARAERTLATCAGLASPSPAADVTAWSAALEGVEAAPSDEPSAEDLDALSGAVAELEAAVAAAPDDADLRTRQAERLLRLAQALLASGQDPSFALGDARTAAEAAEAAGAAGGRAAAVAAVASRLLDDGERVGWHAARALPQLLATPTDPLAVQTLQALARAATGAAYTAMHVGTAPSAADIADAWCAWQVLLAHPAGSAADANLALTFLEALGARAEQAAFGVRAVERFPDSSDLHAWLRAQVLRDAGGAALEVTYDALAEVHGDEPDFQWFRGVAQFAAAEAQVVNQAPDAALSAYARAVASLRASAAARAEYLDSANHYIALALAGSARLQLAAGQLDLALGDIRAALELRPQSALSVDGLGRTPSETAAEIRRALGSAGREADAEALRALNAGGERSAG